jgi:outer membrane protein assembly factor BamB
VLSSPAVVSTVIYVGSNDGNVYAISNAAAVPSQDATSGFEVTPIFIELNIVGLVIVGLVIVGLVIAAYAMKTYRQ